MSDEPARSVSEELARLLTVLRELRERCPWDREQSIASLGKHLVEEAYEALDAIERNDPRAIIDELGDLIAQAIAVAVIGEEAAALRPREDPAMGGRQTRAASSACLRRHIGDDFG